MDRIEAAEILLDTREAIEEALEQARTALEACGDEFLWEQAEAYWLSHIADAVGGSGMVTMQDTIDALEREEED
ncbi:MAG: hypothetical protein R6X33_12980 [Candidatus Brocadiia bacterium]